MELGLNVSDFLRCAHCDKNKATRWTGPDGQDHDACCEACFVELFAECENKRLEFRCKYGLVGVSR
jgi:hypothetical protein